MSEAPRANTKLPRHAAGKMELQGGTGPITKMCPCGSFLEIYKQDKTFRVQTPESIDPDNTNPDAPWVVSPVADVGSSNPIVARVLLQSREMLDLAMFEGDIDKVAVLSHLHSCKEMLLACERVSTRVASRIDEIIINITAHGVAKDNHGRGLNPFPQVHDLELDCGTFLVQVNRAIKLICELPSMFIQLNKIDTNFDHLAERLSDALGETSSISTFVRGNAESVRSLIELRNFHEHPKQIRTVIENFLVLPDGQIQTPTWYLKGQEVVKPRPIMEDMAAIVEFILGVTECMFIHLLMHRISNEFPFCIQEVSEEERNSAVPIRYKLSLDVTRMQETN
ncbi:hypothetical protein ACVWXR_004911 [Pseudomonas lurida]